MDGSVCASRGRDAGDPNVGRACSVSYEQTLNSSDRTDSHLSLVPFRYHNPGSAHNTSIAANPTAQECQPESGSLLRSRSNNSSPPAFWE